MNPEGLRNAKEFVNHKILDCIGDLYTSGYRIIAKIKCSQGGHYLTNQLLRKVFENKDNFSILEIKEKNLPHTLINRKLLKSIAWSYRYLYKYILTNYNDFMKLNTFFSLFVIIFLLISCSKKVENKTLINEKSLDLQVLEAYEQGMKSLEDGDVLFAAIL